MNNIGKEQYDHIAIPEEALCAAIEKGMRKGRRAEWKKRMRSGMLASAAAVFLLFTSANVPGIYAYAKEIPVVRVFVQALHVGSGGRAQDGVTLLVEGEEKDIRLSFRREQAQTEEVLAYSVRSFLAPPRVEIAFQGLEEKNRTQMEEQLGALAAVQDVYEAVSLKEEEVRLVVVLEKGYNYEVLEYQNPGELIMSFYQDAYYEAGEKHPEQQIYYLRTPALADAQEIQKWLKEYAEEEPSQIRTAGGEEILVLGEFDTEEEGEEYRKRLSAQHESGMEWSCGSGKAGEIPE